MANQVVWVLAVDHRHGTNITVFASKEGAETDLLEYVNEYAEEVDLSDEITDPAERISAYFDAADGEGYILTEAEVQR